MYIVTDGGDRVLSRHQTLSGALAAAKSHTMWSVWSAREWDREDGMPVESSR